MLLPSANDTSTPDRLAQIREYYNCFNQRRIADAAAMFAEPAAGTRSEGA